MLQEAGSYQSLISTDCNTYPFHIHNHMLLLMLIYTLPECVSDPNPHRLEHCSMEVNTHTFESSSILSQMIIPDCKVLGCILLMKPKSCCVGSSDHIECSKWSEMSSIGKKNFEHVSCHLWNLALSPMKCPCFPFLDSGPWDVIVDTGPFFHAAICQPNRSRKPALRISVLKS